MLDLRQPYLVQYRKPHFYPHLVSLNCRERFDVHLSWQVF